MLNLDVYSTRAAIRSQEPLTVGLVGGEAHFRFSDPWKNLTKTVVFRQGDKTVDVVGVTSKAVIPWEVLQKPGLPVYIGIYGSDRNGAVVIPTVWAQTDPVLESADPMVDASTAPTLPVYQQIQGQVDVLTPLVVELTKDDDGVCQADHTFAEIEAALTAGRPVYCRCGRAILHLCDYVSSFSIQFGRGTGSRTREYVLFARNGTISYHSNELALYSETVKVDTALTVSGQAADAKAVGDAISALSDEIDGLFAVTGESPNIFNGNLTAGYMNTSGRIVVDDGTEYAYTDYIEVKSTTFIVTGDSIEIGKRINVPLRFVTAFDADKNVLASYGRSNAGGETAIDGDASNAITITLDASVKYMVLTFYAPTRKYENISVSFDVSAVEYVPYGTGGKADKLKEEVLPDNIKVQYLAKYLRGKTVAVFGDSIMYGAGNGGTGAVDMLAEKYGMAVEKYCVSGATMGVRTDDESYTADEVHHIAQQVRNAIEAGISPDLIVLNGGTNDAHLEITIGEMTEVYTAPTTESYFADGFETVAYLLTKNYVGVPIIYMRAHNMSSRTYNGQIEYGELANKIAEKWGIRNVDMYIRMNTQLEEYRTRYLSDYTHPNKTGYETYYVPALEDYIFSEIVH